MFSNRKVAHPDWLAHNSLERTLKLYREGTLPKSIEAWMLVTPMKHALRSIYGCSNFRIGLWFIWEAICENFQQLKWRAQAQEGKPNENV